MMTRPASSGVDWPSRAETIQRRPTTARMAIQAASRTIVITLLMIVHYAKVDGTLCSLGRASHSLKARLPC